MTRKINILQVTFGMNIGGMERVIQLLCRYVDKERFRIKVFCLNLKGELAKELEQEGYEIIYSENQSRLDRYLRAGSIAKIIREHKIDILHTHHTPAFLDGFVAAWFARVPVFINTDHCKKYPAPRRFMVSERIASIFTDKIVAVSSHTKQDLIQYEGIPESKIGVIYNGIESPDPVSEEELSELRKEFRIKPGEQVVGCVSRLDEQKGYDLFIEAAAHILKEVPQTRFIIVGGGIKEKELKKQVALLNINEKVIFTGWRLDAVKILNLFDVFLLTSHFEGMPMVLLEAMAAGKPVVATAVGGNPEVVETGETGFIIKTRNPQEIARCVTSILVDPSLKKKFRTKSVERFENHFQAQKMVASYCHLYESLLAGKGYL